MTRREYLYLIYILASASQFPDLSKLSNVYIMQAAALKFIHPLIALFLFFFSFDKIPNTRQSLIPFEIITRFWN